MSELSALRCLIIESARQIAGSLAGVTDSDAAVMVTLAVIFVVLVGAMLMPILWWAARRPLVRRAASWAVQFGIRCLLWQLIKWVLFPLPLE